MNAACSNEDPVYDSENILRELFKGFKSLSEFDLTITIDKFWSGSPS